MDRRKDFPRVPLWIRPSGERPGVGGVYPYRPRLPWQQEWPERPERPDRPERPERFERPPRPPREARPKRRPRVRIRPPRYEVVPIERITLRNPVHLADWENRATIVEDHAELVRRAKETSQAPWPIQVWKMGDECVLARGFASLAAAVDAGLTEVRVVVAARFPRWELLWVDPKTIQGPDPLLSRALEAQKKVRSVGWVFPPLVVTSNGSGRYILGRGKRAAARLWAAQAEKLPLVPIVIRPQPRRAVVAGTIQVEANRVRVVLPRHLRKMNKPLPMRLLNEVASGRLRPIRVRRASDGGYELVDGLLRLRAAQEVGVRLIPAIVEVELPQGRE